MQKLLRDDRHVDEQTGYNCRGDLPTAQLVGQVPHQLLSVQAKVTEQPTGKDENG